MIRRSKLESSVAILSYLAKNPKVNFTPIMYASNLAWKVLHPMLDDMESKGWIKVEPLSPPSPQAAYYRKRFMRKGEPKRRTVIKRTYELTEEGKQLVFWWDTFIRAYEEVKEKPITVQEY